MKIVFQTDWLPEPEHGGFYQAAARGWFAPAGLDVDIRPGGPGARVLARTALGEVDIAMWRADDVIVARSRGLPLVIVGIVLQHDSQALLVHESSPVKTFADLEGRTVMAGLGVAWTEHLRHTLGIRFNVVPLTFGLQRFLGDPDLVQQCILTNEPFLAREQGVPVRVLPIRDTGYDPYCVLVAREEWARGHAGTVRAFAAAARRGWEDYLGGDPEPADALIRSRRPDGGMTPRFMEFSRTAMREHHLVTGDPAAGERAGLLDGKRLAALITHLERMGLLESPVAVDDIVARDCLEETPARP